MLKYLKNKYIFEINIYYFFITFLIKVYLNHYVQLLRPFRLENMLKIFFIKFHLIYIYSKEFMK